MLFYYNGDATSEDTEFGLKKATGICKGAVESEVLVSDGLDSPRVSNCEVSMYCVNNSDENLRLFFHIFKFHKCLNISQIFLILISFSRTSRLCWMKFNAYINPFGADLNLKKKSTTISIIRYKHFSISHFCR